MPANRPTRPSPGLSRFSLRLTMLVTVSVVVVGIALWLVRPNPSVAPASANDRTIEVTMAGFQPARLAIPAGKAVTLRLVNPDSPYHTDGGGVHQFAVPALGVDVKVAPRSSAQVTLPAAPPGTYTFYCDTCCGGKENPSMQGAIVVS